MKDKETTWMLDSKPTYPSLSESAKADVVIVGGGMAGILTAYELINAGKKVILVDKGEIGAGTTSYTTAFLTQSIDTDYEDLIKSFGFKKAQTIISSHRIAIDRIQEITKKHSIDCDLTPCSNYIYANTKEDAESFPHASKIAKSFDVDTEYIEDGTSLGFKNEGYLKMKNQGKFHPLKFLYNVAQEAVKEGGEIYEHTEVLYIDKEGKNPIVKTNKGDIEAQWVIVATYHPLDNPLSLYFRKGTYVSYAMELGVHDMDLKEGTYEDTENPYHYFRVDKEDDGFRVVIGGADHRKDIPVDPIRNFNELVEYCDSIIPKSKRTIRRKWTGDMLEPIDGIPSIGRIDKSRTLYTLGFSGNGMTYSMISALLFKDIIIGKKNEWEDIYRPRRTPTFNSMLIKGRDYMEELIEGALKNLFTQPKDKFKG
jgi:glycine/D-amino acid oxidase-like deaminating enzyme